ncbi:DNA replication/repair protein RecF [Psittacicella hinzii]|uniref:DNA replication and repair protein RecF n=1 Tax=Psittacicella hinzii TaxID=2028575 RepID=A0A3A1YC28_9GAMM|nr:DNA replication/repair protein RecF [Psittacicella hinzii]RIY35245.1 DNA replication/repair protein RecF [Psittacicella hinzii]
MFIKQLNLVNFRNIDNLTLKPGRKLNFVTGHNGAGKTSILEAIFLVSHQRSFKSKKGALVQEGKDNLAVYMQVDNDRNIDHNLGVKIDSKLALTNYLDGAKVEAKETSKLLAVQLIAPDIIQLIDGTPEFRRRYLNWGMFYHYVDFIDLWRKTENLHKNRNSYLKQFKDYLDSGKRIPESELQAYQGYITNLVTYSEELNLKYEKYFALLAEKVQDLLKIFLPEIPITLEYERGWKNDSSLAQILESRFEQDVYSGWARYGIHRFDLSIKCFNLPASEILSRGQQKLLAIALKMAQVDILYEHAQEDCIFVIDDIAAELDQNKQKLFATKLLSNPSQIFMSYIDNSGLNIFNGLIDTWDEFSLEKGKLTHHLVNGEEVISQEFNLDQYFTDNEKEPA